MKYIISGTDRPGSNSLKVSQFVQKIYKSFGEDVEIIDLSHLQLSSSKGPFYGQIAPGNFGEVIEKINHSDGLIMVVPEYNGSVPGILKYFIDHWKYPETFEYRPVCMIGLGGIFGGLRPVEHLQQVFSYRNSFFYPERVFMMNVWKMIDADARITDPLVVSLLEKQAQGFRAFCSALQVAGLDAESRRPKVP